MALNLRQQRFVDEYLIDGNATAAYKRAGYKAKGHAIETNAARLLRNAEIQGAVELGQSLRTKRTQVSQDRVIEELARVAFADPRTIAEWGVHGLSLKPSTELTDEQAATIESIAYSQSSGESSSSTSVRFKLHNKLNALKMLGEHLGMFQEKAPIDVLLNAFPEPIRSAIRRALALAVQSGGSDGGGGTSAANKVSG